VVKNHRLSVVFSSSRRFSPPISNPPAFSWWLLSLQDAHFVITDLQHQRLGDMTDAHAQAEGYPDLESYQAIILKMHKGLTWNNDDLAWVHTFVRQTDN
jgi:hypothetical protein